MIYGQPSVPQRLKPHHFSFNYGTAEAVPLSKTLKLIATKLARITD